MNTKLNSSLKYNRSNNNLSNKITPSSSINKSSSPTSTSDKLLSPSTSTKPSTAYNSKTATSFKSSKPTFELISSAYQQQFIRDLRLNFKPIKSTTKEEEISTHTTSSSSTNPANLALLADKLGLSNSYTPENIYLTNEQWDDVKIKSLSRGDSKSNCSICYEDYKNNKQILLSCSHTFHTACIASFEKFTSSKQCPLCKQYYSSIKINDGYEYYLYKNAVIIQSNWRGYESRLKFAILISNSNVTLVPILYRKFVLKNISSVTDKFIEYSDNVNDEIDALFAEIDNNINNSRTTFNIVDSNFDVDYNSQWESIKQKALDRNEPECPICMNLFESKNQVLLSCSHVFHDTCLLSFEKFTNTCKCPICRSEYTKFKLK